MPSAKLRNDNIDYARGWFFVTTQVAHNKSAFGVIAGGKCELNELGRRVEERWRDLFRHRAELWCDEFVVMPNHFHAVLKIHHHDDNRIPHLSRAMQIFKSIAAHEYLALLKAGKCPDIGGQLWQRSYYDDLITSRRDLDAIRAYIAANPARWEADRFGPVTTHHAGNLELLLEPCVAFVASEGGGVEAPPPREYVPEGAATAGAGRRRRPVISTFCSPQERALLAKCLATGRAHIHVLPAGIPQPLPAAWARACTEGKALLLSPFPPGTSLNKQRAIWCNQYVLNHAETVWHGTIRTGGTLETLLRLWQPHPGGMEQTLGAGTKPRPRDSACAGGASSPSSSSRAGGASSPPPTTRKATP